MISRRLLIYLLVLHAVVLAGILWLLADQPAWLLAAELGLVLSLAIGTSLWRNQRNVNRMLRDGTAALRDQDYSLRLQQVGVRDVDDLINVYNRLLEQIRSERLANKRRQHFLTLLVEATSLGVITMDFDGGIADINSWGRKQLGLPIGPDENRVVPAQLRDIDHPLARELAQLGEEERRVVKLVDNQRYRCESASFIDRGFNRRFLILQDITDELNDAEVAAYGQVIRMMAHEVNNTTASTRSLLQSLIDTQDLDDATFRELATEYLPLVAERGESLNEFMRRFADVVRLPQPVFAPVDLADLLTRQVRLAEPICTAVDVALELSLKPAVIQGDEPLLEQVVINALTNARESIGEGGVIQVSCDHRGFTIADNGAGIDAETQGALFTPFFSTKPTGQGIGLTLTRDILERHRATYSLETGKDGWTRLNVVFA